MDEKIYQWTVWTSYGEGWLGDLKRAILGHRACKKYDCDNVTIGPGIFQLHYMDGDGSSIFIPAQYVMAYRHNFGGNEARARIQSERENGGGKPIVDSSPGFYS